MKKSQREYFDRQLELVLAELPEPVHDLLDRVPMYVDDEPTPEVLRRTGVHDARHLYGLYTGIPLGQRSVEASGVLSDVIHLFRCGILAASERAEGGYDDGVLREQIRITILHELGHHHGLTERDLRDLGYA